MAQENNHASRIHSSLIPSTISAVSSFEANGGRLSDASGFGSNPLLSSPGLISQRQAALESNIASPEELFGLIVNGIIQPFSDAVEYMIYLTNDFRRHL